jgi:hypothetical protein
VLTSSFAAVGYAQGGRRVHRGRLDRQGDRRARRLGLRGT